MGKGYSITYDGAKRYTKSPGEKTLIGRYLVFILLITTLSISILVPKNKALLRSIFIPGNDQVTTEAAKELITQLQNGKNTVEALEVFCRQILNNGK